MRIGIIGAVRHDAAVANSRGPETLQNPAAATGARAVTVTEAVRDRDV